MSAQGQPLDPDELLVYTLIRRGTVLASTMEYLIDLCLADPQVAAQYGDKESELKERVREMCAKLWDGYSTA